MYELLLVGCMSLYGWAYANDHEDMLIGLNSRCVTFSDAHKNVLSPVKLKTLWAILFESLPVVWAACTIFSQMNILRLQDKMLAC